MMLDDYCQEYAQKYYCVDKIYARFGPSRNDASYKWRCYSYDNLEANRFYYNSGDAVFAQDAEIKAIIEGHPDSKFII